MEKIIFKESNHWYDHLGNSVTCVPYAKPRREGLCPACNNVTWSDAKGDKSTCKLCKAKIYVGDFETVKGREPALKDARKYGLFPSISRMCSYGEMEFTLSSWSKNELIKWVMDNYKADRRQWLRTIQGGMRDFENRFSDPGSYVHGQIAKAMEGQEYDQTPTIIRVVAEVRQWLSGLGATAPVMEHGYCDPEILGLGGCIDIQANGITADFKCKMNPGTFETLKTGKGRSYLDSAIKQLAGYMHISKVQDRCFVVPIRLDETHPDSGEICPIELTEDELVWGLKAISRNAEAWFVNKRYDPREMYARNECWDSSEILKGER